MEYKAIVRVTGGKDSLGIADQDFRWSGDNAEDVLAWAMNFAEGYTTAIASGKNGIRVWHPCSMPTDGYHWWTRYGLDVKVVNKDGKVVRKPEDLA